MVPTGDTVLMCVYEIEGGRERESSCFQRYSCATKKNTRRTLEKRLISPSFSRELSIMSWGLRKSVFHGLFFSTLLTYLIVTTRDILIWLKPTANARKKASKAIAAAPHCPPGRSLKRAWKTIGVFGADASVQFVVTTSSAWSDS
ncbi:hypothetical protein PINS_up019752 [Pythium insidiosum]|nr:hypothetical protein PINS_up019752 [Pythium insidiosum]